MNQKTLFMYTVQSLALIMYIVQLKAFLINYVSIFYLFTWKFIFAFSAPNLRNFPQNEGENKDVNQTTVQQHFTTFSKLLFLCLCLSTFRENSCSMFTIHIKGWVIWFLSSRFILFKEFVQIFWPGIVIIKLNGNSKNIKIPH